MFNWLTVLVKRLFTIGEANVNAVIDKFEEPIKMTEQGIRELKDMLTEVLESFAAIKSMAITAQKDYENTLKKSIEYERKATTLLLAAKNGQIEADEADRLATLAITKKAQFDSLTSTKKKEYDRQSKATEILKNRIEELRSAVQNAERDLTELKRRQQTAQTQLKVNKQLSTIDTSGTIAMIERMKTKVHDEENLALAYGSMVEDNKSLDDEITDALGTQNIEQTDALKDLKLQLGITIEEQKTT